MVWLRLLGEGGLLTSAGTVLVVVATIPLWRRPVARPEPAADGHQSPSAHRTPVK
ncbi:hypothetical protein [Nonomuraea sp. SYSU D8015]|uniref:hypothetical protein n=1 Tax=Nonomuraea sp. SYSU D8015 TaxID=2593644 RepID=UPI0016613867|nr:hypothetical protein [Nonomuraea sp. SYSU D8015]